MVPMFEEYLPEMEGDTSESVRQMLLDDIMTLNGKQTIYQMIRFAERVADRGGTPEDPLEYKHEYLRRLEKRINSRVAGLQRGEVSPNQYLLHGSLDLLNAMKSRGMQLYLASGTDEVYVKREAKLLGVAEYFGKHIHGALDNYKNFSKRQVIDRILKKNQVSGEQLLIFGDGYVEIEDCKNVGGLAVAVASDEANNGSGEFDEWKRNRLLGVGADIVIPDYRDAELLLNVVEGK